jgi:hypothetical protein
MNFLYKGFNPESKVGIKKIFDEIVENDKDGEDAEATAMDNMLFPDEDSEKGFDWTLGE